MSGSIDLSDALVSDGGQVTVDLATVYSQGLMGVVDDVALKWFEYFCGDRILDWDSQDRDSYRLLSDMVLSFMRGESVMGAESYIREVMDSNGIPESVYRHPGSGTTTGTVGGHTVTVENPTADLFEQGWIKKFKSHYHKDGNYVMDLMRSVLRMRPSRSVNPRAWGQ